MRNFARSTISGSRAAFSMTVVPSAAVAAMSRFSVAPTLGIVERDDGAVEIVGAHLDEAVLDLDGRAEPLQPADVEVDAPRADVAATGHRDHRPSRVAPRADP